MARRMAKLQRERERQAAIELRTRAISGLQAISRAKAKEEACGQDIDDVVDDIQMERQLSPTAYELYKDPGQWETIRDINPDDYQSDEEDCVVAHDDISSPAAADDEDPDLFKVRERRVLDFSAGEKKSPVPVHQQRFDHTGVDGLCSPWYPFKSAFDFSIARWLNRHKATAAMITEGYNSGLLSSVWIALLTAACVLILCFRIKEIRLPGALRIQCMLSLTPWNPLLVMSLGSKEKLGSMPTKRTKFSRSTIGALAQSSGTFFSSRRTSTT